MKFLKIITREGMHYVRLEDIRAIHIASTITINTPVKTMQYEALNGKEIKEQIDVYQTK